MLKSSKTLPMREGAQSGERIAHDTAPQPAAHSRAAVADGNSHRNKKVASQA
jgi:hypothetical protein